MWLILGMYNVVYNLGNKYSPRPFRRSTLAEGEAACSGAVVWRTGQVGGQAWSWQEGVEGGNWGLHWRDLCGAVSGEAHIVFPAREIGDVLFGWYAVQFNARAATGGKEAQLMHQGVMVGTP